MAMVRTALMAVVVALTAAYQQRRSVPGSTLELRESGKAWSLKRLVGSGGRCLNFLHIPKTAGSTIERDSWSQLASNAVVGWGSRDMALRECSHPAKSKWPTCNLDVDGDGKEDTQGCSAWHVPPFLDPVLLRHYGECETFCVVRNPTTRLVSEYRNWHHRDEDCESSKFETWAAKQMQIEQGLPYMSDCHFVPQVKYVFGPGDPQGGTARQCQHVLHFESLQAEFRALMEDFGLPVKLRSHELNHHCDINVSRRLEASIESSYGGDFDAFGYQRIASTMGASALFSVDSQED